MVRLSGSRSLVPLAALFLAAAGGGRAQRISAPLPRAVLGDVVEARYSADGRWLVYRADPEVDEAFELFSVRADGSSVPVRLDALTAPDRDVTDFAISPDGARVVYLANQDAADVHELYTVPIDGSAAPLKLNAALVEDGDVTDFALSPSGARVVYRADTFVNQRFTLHSVPIDRSQAPVVINTPLGAGGSDVEEFLFTPDGARVVFHVDQRTYHEIGVSPADGSAPATSLWTGAGIPQTFLVDPTGARVLYRLAASSVLLHSLLLAGGQAPVLLSPALNANREVAEFQVAGDGRTVLFRADTENSPRVYELFAAPSDGSAAPLRLHPPLPSGKDVGPTIAITADDTRAVYRTEYLSGGAWVYDLFVVPLDASAAPLRISGPPSTFGGPFDFELSSDGLWLAYTHVDTSWALFTTRLDGAASPLPFTTAFGCIPPFRIAPDGSALVYGEGCASANGDVRLFARPLDGSAPAVELGGPAGRIPFDGFELAPGGERVAFLADENAPDEFDLFTRALDGSGAPLQLSDPLPPNAFAENVARFRTDDARALYAEGQRLVGVSTHGGPVVELTSALHTQAAEPFALAAGGRRALFLALRSGLPRLFSAPADGSGVAVELNPTNLWVTRFQLTADGARVGFLAYRSGHVELFGAPCDGSASAVRISALSNGGAGVSEFRLTPDGQRAVYLADDLVPGQLELFAGDGGAPAVRLNPPMAANVDVDATFRLSPDGTRVVFSESGAQLYGAPVDGSTPAALLAAQLPYGVPEPFRISADSTFVVLQTFQLQGFSRIPITGGSGLPLVTFGSGGNTVTSFELSPLGTHLVYVADQEVVGRYELYRVPLDASAPPRVLSGAPNAAADDVLEFQVAPDQSRVVYRARRFDAQNAWTEDLLSAPFDASASPVRLSQPLAWLSNVSSFRLGGGGAVALYRVDPSDTLFELYRVPTDGSAPPVRLSPPAAPGGKVQTDFAPTPDGALALFRLDTKLAGAFELYAAPLVHEPRPSGPPR